MTPFVLTPAVDVDPAEYRRLLGYPRDAELSERASELADGARAWYAENGEPWIYTRPAESLELSAGSVEIEGIAFSSSRLRTALQMAGAHGVSLTAVSAGPEAEEEAGRLWQEGKPDEYFFLEMFASAVVEHLVMLAGASLCAWADGQGMAVLPHSSPGYSQWDVAEQGALLGLLQGGKALPGPLHALESGALAPKKSQLAVFGITRFRDRVARLADLVPCQECALGNCQYRRVPYLRARRNVESVAPAPEPAPAAYTVNPRALRRWAGQRLTLKTRGDGSTEARFRYEGVTCTNMGRPLAFDYEVTLGPRERGYPILSQRCAPAAGDSGHQFMCQYIADGPELMDALGREKPLAGRPLAEVLGWSRSPLAAGCYCEASSRDHKWGLVLETLHYALHHSKSDETDV